MYQDFFGETASACRLNFEFELRLQDKASDVQFHDRM